MFSTKIKTHLINHLRRKFPCKIVNKNISILNVSWLFTSEGIKKTNVNANVNNVNVLSEKYLKI